MSKKLTKIANRISDVFWDEGWKWLTFRGETLPEPFTPSADHVKDYITRMSDSGAGFGSGIHERGRIFLRERGDGKTEVYLRMGTY